MRVRRIAAVVLAAGASRRLGEPKQLIVVGGERLLERAVRTAAEAGCEPIFVVLGAEADRIEAACALGDAVVLINSGWEEGMASSIRLGVQAAILSAADGSILLTCDQPGVTPAHLHLLLEAGAGGAVAASSYGGTQGVPAYFPAGHLKALLDLRGDTGAREAMRLAASVPLALGDLDVDTAASLAAVRQAFR